ncbi:hypothetical protein GTQ99_23750, partial [Kineococcus sp. T13]|uniref:hypothetical protein n=1 Tax=Kineococcus vitellinus TaxID=2696565 RepID=UPI001411C27E
FSVPDLLATDALLDRLGAHRATDGDLGDTVARLLDAYALHADPDTAGVRHLPIDEIVAASEAEPEPGPVEAPRVLLARRRTLQRLGRGGAATAAVLALLGGTAAAAATGAGSLGARGGPVSTAVSAQLPEWFPDTVFTAIAGTPTERAQRELQQAVREARAGDPEAALARVSNLHEQLAAADIDGALAAAVASTLVALRSGELPDEDVLAAAQADPAAPGPAPT